MRTVTEMVDQVRDLLQDVQKENWGDPDIKSALRDATEVFSYDLLVHPIGQRILLEWSTETLLASNKEEYLIPDGCLRVHRVQYREDTSSNWQYLRHRKRQPGKTPPPKFWSQALEEGKIVIWPAFTSVASQEYRLRYYRRIDFPLDSGTFNDPYGDGSVSKNYPIYLDSIVEYGAALSLAGQEYLEQSQYKTILNQYNRHFQSIVNSVPMDWPDRHRLTAFQKNQEDED